MNPRNINRHQSLAGRENEREKARRADRSMEREGTHGPKRCLHLRNTDGSFYHCREIWCSLSAPIADYASNNSRRTDGTIIGTSYQMQAAILCCYQERPSVRSFAIVYIFF